MTLTERQEEALQKRAADEGQFSDWIYYLSVRRDDARLREAAENLNPADTRGILAARVIALSEDPEPAVSLISQLNGEPDPWIYYTLGKSLLAQSKVKEALVLALRRLDADKRDVALLNLLAKYLLSTRQHELSREVIQRSLKLNPHQDDMLAIDALAEARQDLPFALYLDVYPEYHDVSFYLPVYNVEKYIRQAIEGVYAQNYPIREILVIDDASPDRSIEIAREYPVRVIEHEENKGLAAARNTAFQHAEGKFVGAVDTDAWPSTDFTKIILMDFENSDPHMSGAGGKLVEANHTAPPDKWRAKYMAQEQGPLRKCTPEGLFGSNTIFRRDAVLDVGGYDEKYRTNAEDVGISRALRGAGYWFFYTPYAIAYHGRTDTVPTVLRTMWNWVFPGKFEAGVYGEPYYIMMSIQRIREAVDYFIQTDLRDGDVDSLYIDVLCLFYLPFLDLNFAARTGTIGVADARYVQESMLSSLRTLEEQFGPGLHDKVRNDVSHLMQAEPGDQPVKPEFETWIRIFSRDLEGTYRHIDQELYQIILKSPGA